jgi:hypothetical protein
MAANGFFVDDEPYNTPTLRTDEPLPVEATAYFRASAPADGPTPPPVELYEEFLEALGDDGHLDPFFEDRPGIGRASRVVVLPVITLALRRDGELTGLYPCWKDGHHYSIEQGLEALERGEDAENLR